MSLRSIAGRLLAITIALALAGVSGITLLFAVTLQTDRDGAERLQAATALQDDIADVRATLGEMHAAVLGYIVTGDLAILTPYRDGGNALKEEIDRLLKGSTSLPLVADEIPQLQASILSWQTDWADPAINAYHRSDAAYQTSDEVGSGSTLFARIHDQLAELDGLATAEAAAASAAATQLESMRIVIFVGTGVAIVVFTVALAMLLKRSVVEPIQRLVVVAGRVQEGEDIPFPEETSTELGRLSSALELMRLRLTDSNRWAEVRRMDEEAQADEQRVVNDYTELLTYLVDEREVVVAATVAIEQALTPTGIAVHLLNSSQDRAGVTLKRGDIVAEDLARHTLDRCPGVRRGSSYLHEDMSRPLAVPCPAVEASSGTMACLPLSSGTERIGAIHVTWKEITKPRQGAWSVVERVCSQAGLTIANRRLVASLEASANTDPRTRLPNSRSFDVQAERILASRGSDSVGVLMLDLDHFKDLNDRFGHPAGDEALRVFAELLRRSLRPGDVPARYGGEEFAVLLPGADLQAAESVAERIRAGLEATPILLGPGIVARITVSAGVAVAPSDGTERMALLAAADRALYGAKHGGRNRVVSAAAVDSEGNVVPKDEAGQGKGSASQEHAGAA